jgi:peptidoglycan hydrolase-like protein with peptidoglycan-binding domain
MAGQTRVFTVATGQEHRFVLDPKVMCSELAGPHFDFDRTFVRVNGMTALGQIAETMSKHADKKAAIFGHTDTVGDERANKVLSEQRARMVHAALTHKVDVWEERFNTEHWGTQIIQAILNALGAPAADPKAARGPLREDGILGPSTRAALDSFQHEHGIQEDGAGVKTRAALFRAYIEQAIPQPVDGGQILSIGGAPYMGCGEFNPFTEGVADESSRRVVVILYSPSKAPSGLPCAIDDVTPCRSNLLADGETAPGDRTPHFRCRVYREIADRCPCAPSAPMMPFRVQIHDDVYEPCANVEYRLGLPSGRVVVGKTDGAGWLRSSVPKGKQVVSVTYNQPHDRGELSLRVRLTDDPSSDDALLAHLFNFGFCHEDGSDTGMILRFQSASELALTGTLDGATRDAIHKIVNGADTSMRDELRESP